MKLPKFLLADNSDYEEAFVLHTEYPRFLINVETDEVEWFDEVDEEEADVQNQVKNILDDAYAFFENELEAYEEEEEDEDEDEYGV